MEKQWTVAILGNSLLMAGLEASLRGQDSLRVVQVPAGGYGVGARLAALRPDVAIFDLDAPEAQEILDLLKDCLGWGLIGLGIAGNRVLVYSCRAHAATSARDVVELIQGEVRRLEPGPDGMEETHAK